MKKPLFIATCLALVGGGAASVILADRLGWLSNAPAANARCRHQVAAAQCPFCNSALVAAKGQCAEHGVPEALCTRCHPWLIAAFKVEKDWCAGHGVPESQCVLCHPGLAVAGGAGPSGTALNRERQGNGQPSISLIQSQTTIPRSQRPPSVTCTTERTTVRLADPAVADRAGFEIARVERQAVTKSLVCNAELAFNGDRVAHVASRAPGVVQEVSRQLGDHVEAGEALAIIDSVDLGNAKAEYLHARALLDLWQADYERKRDLAESGAAALRDVQEAQTSYLQAKIAQSRSAQRLRNLGLNEDQLQGVAVANDTGSLLTVAAPFSGTVIDRHAVVGEVVDTERILLTIADTSTMWAMLDINEDDSGSVGLGQSVVMTFAGPNERAIGEVTWIASQVDPRTRMLRARAVVGNPEGSLRANMFGRGEVVVADRAERLVVPREAVQWEGCCNVVFVRLSPTEYQPRKIRPAFVTEHWCVLEDGSGVDEGDPVITTGSYLLKTEILKGNIGAGCCER